MSKFLPIQLSKTEDKKGFSFQCPGCGCAHFIQTNKEFSPCWEFNNDVNKPTVSPSIRVRSVRDGRNGVCHSFIKEGKIQFLGDCIHALKNQIVELPEWE